MSKRLFGSWKIGYSEADTRSVNWLTSRRLAYSFCSCEPPYGEGESFRVLLYVRESPLVHQGEGESIWIARDVTV